MALIRLLEMATAVSRIQDEVISNTMPVLWGTSQYVVDTESSSTLAVRIGNVFQRQLSTAHPYWLTSGLPDGGIQLVHELCALRDRVAFGRRSVTKEEVEKLAVVASVLLDSIALPAGWIGHSGELDPGIRQKPTGEWVMLEIRGDQRRYIALDGSGGTFELPKETDAELTDQDSLATRTSPEERYKENARLSSLSIDPGGKMRKMIRDRLTSMHSCAALRSGVQAADQLGLGLHFVALSRSGMPWLAVDQVADLGAEVSDSIKKVCDSALALGVPYAAISDGHHWRWFRCVSDEEVVELDDPTAIETGP